MTATVGRLVVDVLTNQSGGAVAYGDVVILDTAHDDSFTTTTTGAYTGMVGVCIEPAGIASSASGRIQFGGKCAQINLSASVTRGHYIKTHTVAKQGADAGTSRVVGSFGQITKTGSTPPVELFGFPDAASSSAAAGTPALTLSTSNSAGVAATFVATDATVAVFDATAPSTQAFADAAATGSAGTAARRDHKHAMPTVSSSEAFITGDVSIGSANTFVDGPSLSLAAGTYVLMGTVVVTSGDAPCFLTAKLWDGTNVWHVPNTYVTTPGGHHSIAVFAANIVLGSTTTVKISVAASTFTTGSTIKATAAANGTTNKATKIVALRIA